MPLSESEELELLELERQKSLSPGPSGMQKLAQTASNFVMPRTDIPTTAMGLMKFIAPPIQPTSPIQFPMQLQTMGQKIGDAGRASAPGIAEKNAFGSPPVSALFATGADVVAKNAQPDVVNLFGGMAGEMAPAALGQMAGDLPSSIASRFLKAPKSLAEARLNKGEATVGEDFLKNDSLNPKGFLEMPSGNKKDIFKSTKKMISELGKQADQKINAIAGGAEKSRFGTGSQISKSDLAVRKSAFNNVVDEMIKNVEDWDTDGKSLSLLNKVKKSETLDFKTANKFREYLGEYVGKRFDKEEVPEKIDAMKSIFGSLRDKIGGVSPELDSILKNQHILYDIQHSVAGEAAKGYGEIPYSIFQSLLKGPLSSPKVAAGMESFFNTRGGGSALNIMKAGNEAKKGLFHQD